MGTPDRLYARLGQTEMPDLAGPDQLLDRARDVLDRHVRIDPVLIEQVDHVEPQTLQRSFGNLPDVLGSTVQAGLSAPGIDLESELGRDRHAPAKRRQCLADQFLVLYGP
jgi:hypothetical protein